MAALTLEKMAAGGMNDQVGGGFHRYSTDERWRVPHFEKMLYDNALLVPAYIEGWQATGNRRFRQVAAKTLDYVAREMTSPGGAFYSATDADSLTPSGHREEGWFFTWTIEELNDALGAEDAHLAAAVYGLDAGQLRGKKCPVFDQTLDRLAVDLGLFAGTAVICRRPNQCGTVCLPSAASGTAAGRQNPGRLERFDDFRLCPRRLRPGRFGLSRPGRSGGGLYPDRMVVDGRLKRSFQRRAARGNGFLDDHAFMVAALLDLFEATADLRWLTHAVELDRVWPVNFMTLKTAGSS
jgi:uncharacterized protein YyaL (SSP411 family)